MRIGLNFFGGNLLDDDASIMFSSRHIAHLCLFISFLLSHQILDGDGGGWDDRRREGYVDFFNFLRLPGGVFAIRSAFAAFIFLTCFIF